MAKKPYHHGNLEETLIEVGLELLDKEGMSGFSLRKVAAACGVSHAAPLRYSVEPPPRKLKKGTSLFHNAIKQSSPCGPWCMRAYTWTKMTLLYPKRALSVNVSDSEAFAGFFEKKAMGVSYGIDPARTAIPKTIAALEGMLKEIL